MPDVGQTGIDKHDAGFEYPKIGLGVGKRPRSGFEELDDSIY
jgi:hypothetical protein